MLVNENAFCPMLTAYYTLQTLSESQGATGYNPLAPYPEHNTSAAPGSVS